MTGFAIDGEVILMTDFKGRTEFQVVDRESGERERLVWTSGSTWIPGMQFIQVLLGRHRHLEIEIAEPKEPDYERCRTCQGAKQWENEEGNWVTCPECMGVS